MSYLQFVRAAWSRMSRADQIRTVLLVVVTAGVIVHHCILWDWYVEDTAISFAFARNLVNGEGLVAYPGGERVEGYSNPTWVALLALVQLVGLDPFAVTRWMQLAIGIATVPVVYRAAREVTGKESDVPLLALAFLAANAQFALWGGAGLENGLFNLLIALGFWGTMRELRTGGIPWSALAWMLLALTRPEGIMYAAVAGFCAMVFQLHARRSLVPTLWWLVLFFVPWGLYQVVHYSYFAWVFPNTYYAKLEDRNEPRMLWDRKAWNWSRNFFHDLGHGFFLPIWLLGVIGDGRVRYALATAAFLVVGLTIELSHDQRWLLPVVLGGVWAAFWLGLRASEEQPPRGLVVGSTLVALGMIALAEGVRYGLGFEPNPIPVPDWFKVVPPYELVVLALLLPIVGYGSRGWQLRTMSWLFCCAVIVFAIYVQWDWMKGFRWYATATVPGAFLFAFGADSFIRLLEEMFTSRPPEPTRWRTWGGLGVAVAVGLIVLQLPANVWHTWTVAESPDPSPRGILTRVQYVQQLGERLHVEGRLVDLDVDQGAHLWWSDFEMMDIAGLVDLPLAHHKFEKAFVREYVFEERKPHYAHVHGQWAGNSKIPTHPEWRRDYVEVPGYPVGKGQLHVGNFVRRDLIVAPEWPHGDLGKVALEGGVVLYGPVVPSEPATGKRMYVEVGVQANLPRKTVEDDFRLVLFATDGQHLATWDLPPGYDWLKPSKWTPGEVFVGKFDLAVPATLPPGPYDLGLVVFGADGLPVMPLAGEAAEIGPAARIGGVDGAPVTLAAGEVRWPGALTVMSVEDRAAAAVADREAALAQAQALDCEAAERSWWLAQKHRPDDKGWHDEHVDEVSRALATCWAVSSDGRPREERVERLVKARVWDWWAPAYRSRATPLADELYAEGMAAYEAQDWESAYRLLADTVEVERSRAWARRYAEEARAWRLGIDPDSLAKKRADEAAAKALADERRKSIKGKPKPAPGAPPREATVEPKPAGDGK